MKHTLPEQIFFFGLLGFIAYLVLLILYPFLSALVLSAIIATVCYPMYRKILGWFPWKHAGPAALLATLAVFGIIVIPLSFIGYILFTEALALYAALNNGYTLSFAPPLGFLEQILGNVAPGVSIDIAQYAQDAAAWVATSIGTFFAGTASAVLIIIIAFVGLFYLFKDGEALVKLCIKLSPLPDTDDEAIVNRLSRSVRSVVVGALSVGLIQGLLTAVGFAIFGIPQAAFWGMITAVAALVPAVGTSLVYVPTVIFLLFSGSYGAAIGIGLWGMFAVGLIDNVIGPYLIGRGTSLHPYLVLISVLGGLSVFGPTGFIVGPVIMSFFLVLLELHTQYTSSLK